MAPRWSVLLPTHDRADVVGYAIRSVLAQTDGDFELLVVGDGCTDDTAEVVTSFSDERARWFDLPKAPGFGYANRNQVLREARGELVAFMAHDDLVFPDHLEQLGAVFAEKRVEWAYSRPLWMADDGTMVPFAIDLRRPDHFERFMTDGNRIPATCVAYRRSCHERDGYWPEDMERIGDWNLWKRMIGPSKGANLEYVAEPTCIHFRAHWRTGPSWGPPPLPAWLAAAEHGWWPPALSPAMPEGEQPQATTWGWLRDDGPGWVRRVRTGVDSVVDGFAWSAAAELAAVEQRLLKSIHALLQAGDGAAALEVADRALELAPRSAGLHVTRARALLLVDRPIEAEAAARRALELDPTSVGAYLHLAHALARQDRLDEAILAARSGLDIKPDAIGLLTQLGVLSLRIGDVDAAESAARAAAALDPDLPGPRHVLEQVRRTRAIGTGPVGSG